MTPILRASGLSFLIALAGAGCTSAAHRSASTALRVNQPAVIAAGHHFEFHSGMWLNLHHFLHAVARARSRRDTSGPALSDTVGFGARPVDEQRTWDAAVDYYASHLAERDLVLDTMLVTIKDRLARAEDLPSIRNSGVEMRLAAALERVAPVYKAVWWPRHDAANRAWVASMLPLLTQYGDSLAAGVARAFEASWPKPLLRVDVAAYAGGAGAYATTLHVTISSTDGGYKGTRGLEMLFHEASHTIADSLVAALRDLAARSGKNPPFGVLHPIIFFTAGELTRRLVPGYVPFAESAGFWQRGRMAGYLPVIQRHWLPHLDGRSSLREAMRGIIADL